MVRRRQRMAAAVVVVVVLVVLLVRPRAQAAVQDPLEAMIIVTYHPQMVVAREVELVHLVLTERVAAVAVVSQPLVGQVAKVAKVVQEQNKQ